MLHLHRLFLLSLSCWALAACAPKQVPQLPGNTDIPADVPTGLVGVVYPTYLGCTVAEGCERKVAQSFTMPNAEEVGGVTLWIWKHATFNGPAALRVTLVVDAGGTPSESIVPGAEARNEDRPGYVPVWQNFRFRRPVMLEQGRTYWIVAQIDGGTNSRAYLWGESRGDRYKGGRLFYWESVRGSWENAVDHLSSGLDAYFKLLPSSKALSK